jgi:hypothetical protein
MKKVIYCDGCLIASCCATCTRKPKIDEIAVCDTCGIHLPIDDYSYQLEIKNSGELTVYDFCGLECATKFLNAELKKEQK